MSNWLEQATTSYPPLDLSEFRQASNVTAIKQIHDEVTVTVTSLDIRKTTMAEQGRDFFTDKASKLYGISYEEVTKEQRTAAKNLLMDYLYCRADIYPTLDCRITAKLLETVDSDNSLKNLYNRFIRNGGVD